MNCESQVWDHEKIVIIPDHYIFTSDERANRNVDILRDFCLEQDIKYFYDIKDLGDFRVWDVLDFLDEYRILPGMLVTLCISSFFKHAGQSRLQGCMPHCAGTRRPLQTWRGL